MINIFSATSVNGSCHRRAGRALTSSQILESARAGLLARNIGILRFIANDRKYHYGVHMTLTMPGSEVAQIAQPDAISLPSVLAQPELPLPTQTTGTQPNRISKVLELFDQHREGSIDRDRRWIEARLQPEEYKELLETLGKNEDLSAYTHDNIQ